MSVDDNNIYELPLYFRILSIIEGKIMVKVNYKRCGYCGACVGVCENLAINLIEHIVVIDEKKCSDCNLCVIVCPLNALEGEK